VSLPRATQERVAERERLRESDFLRRQNEAAEKLKGLSTREQAVEQARAHYEASLPQLLATLQQQQAGEFADIKTLADVERMAREDMARYVRWDVQQKKIADVAQQLVASLARQTQERQDKFADFVRAEDEALRGQAPRHGGSGEGRCPAEGMPRHAHRPGLRRGGIGAIVARSQGSLLARPSRAAADPRRHTLAGGAGQGQGGRHQARSTGSAAGHRASRRGGADPANRKPQQATRNRERRQRAAGRSGSAQGSSGSRPLGLVLRDGPSVDRFEEETGKDLLAVSFSQIDPKRHAGSIRACPTGRIGTEGHSAR
jgi:hypothetical protein